MKSGWLTIVTVATLYGAYRLYASFVGPILEPEVLAEPVVDSRPAPRNRPLSLSGRIAETYLPRQDWAGSAKYQLQRGEETFIYCNQRLRIEDDKKNKLRVSPFAIVWLNAEDPTSEAHTLVCSSAIIECESMIQLGESNPGRIIAGQLYGDVRITGPDGLDIRGSNFTLSESDQRLYSDHPITFEFGPQPGKMEQVRGSAGSVDITLKESARSLLGNDMPRIGGLRQVTLRKDVKINLVMDEKGRPVPVSIVCDGQFSYDVDALIATFEEAVRVRRPTQEPGQPEQWDRLNCDRLSLVFEEALRKLDGQIAKVPRSGIVPVSASSASVSASSRAEDQFGISLDLELHKLRAEGETVLLGSEENQLVVKTQVVEYDLRTGTLEMRDREQVQARIGNDEISCPSIRVVHDEDQRVRSAECIGKGQILRKNELTSQVEVESTWNDSLMLSHDIESGWDVLEIKGNGRVVQPVQQTGIIADSLMVWLDGQSLQEADGDLQSAMQASTKANGLPVQKVVATSNVAMVSPTLHLETQKLTAHFTAGEVAERRLSPGQPRRASTSSPLFGTADAEEDRAEGDEEQPVVVVADAVTADLVFDPVSEKTDVQRLEANTAVTISRAGDRRAGRREDMQADVGEDDPFTVEADRLTLTNHDGQHVLHLEGTPARIRHSQAEIEGNSLYFDRGGNRAMVDGAGSLILLVENDLEGRPLDVPEPLTVRWVEEMAFDGQHADFVGQVRTKLADSNLLCETMRVSLNQRLSFSDDRPSQEGLDIARVHCQESVSGEYIEWEGTTLIGIRKLQVHEFIVNVHTGEFNARGPGRIDDWRRGGESRRVQLDPNAESASRPVKRDEFPWDYTRVRFAGTMEGNQNDRFLTLNDRVRVIHGPVANSLDVIDRDEFSQDSERAKNAIWIGSQKLQVSVVGGEGDAKNTVRIIAWDDAELEGKVFRARAHSISFDESKEMFTMKGRGTDAVLWHQDQPGQPYNELPGKTIQFVPSKRELTIDGTGSIRGSR